MAGKKKTGTRAEKSCRRRYKFQDYGYRQGMTVIDMK